MENLLSGAELDEFGEQVVREYLGEREVKCLDIEEFIRSYLKLPIFYESIAEKEIDIVLSHTCPFKYEPTEMFIQGIDQSSVDDSTERWLDKIEEAIEYKAWFCGHWHVNKRIDKMHFLFHSVESIEQFMENVNDEN